MLVSARPESPKNIQIHFGLETLFDGKKKKSSGGKSIRRDDREINFESGSPK